MTLWRLFIGTAIGLLLAWLGRRRGLLTRNGAWAVGMAVVIPWVSGGWAWGVVMAVYWLGLALIAPFRRGLKSALTERFAPRHARLGWPEVSARSTWAVLLSLNAIFGAASPQWLLAYVGAMAASAADTLGTELGVLSAQRPRLILNGRAVPAGTAGAISVLGLVAALGGSWLIGLTALLSQAVLAWQAKELIPRLLLWLPLAAMVGGILASLVDALLGATAQAIYYCRACDKHTEYPIHICGRPAEPTRGWPWVNNQIINWICSIIGAAITAGLAVWLAG